MSDTYSPEAIGHDAKRNKTLTLYPVFITKLARQQ